MNVLFLSRWYPHRIDAMSGLFVRNHAEAVSKYVNVVVLYAQEDGDIDKREVVTSRYKGVKEIIVYYPHRRCRLMRAWVWWLAIRAGYKTLKRNGFVPNIIHANILTRYGFVAYLMSKRLHIPYVLSEHWSRYLKENYSYHGIIRKAISRVVVRNASCVMPVSKRLMESMIYCGLKNNNYRVVPNTIDDVFRKNYSIENREKKRLIHISCFDDKSKNVTGIIEAATKLEQKRQDWEMVIVGTGPDENKIKEHCKDLGTTSVIFLGEQSPTKVAKWLQNSDCMVLFSNYETFGIVLIESFTCGTPVITTHCGIADEIVSNENGILVNSKDISALTHQMDWILDNIKHFDKESMKQIASNYTQKHIGEVLLKIYNQAIARY